MTQTIAHAQDSHGHDGHGHGHDGHGHGHDPHLAHHFDSMAQQFDSAKLGIWLFLATEVLFFGGLFAAYVILRMRNPEVFSYASHYLDTIMGGINTCVLIVSSLTMALAVRCAQTRWSWILCEYSKYLITRKPTAPRNVSTRPRISPLRLFVWAQRTARAMVRLETISTQVLIP
ncbi:MAG: heme-copper oxidase subunit III, partial [Phycisphaerales bacterium]